MTRRRRLAAWVTALVAALVIEVAKTALTIGGVEADLLATDGTPPLWQPLTLLVGLALAATSAWLFVTSRCDCR